MNDIRGIHRAYASRHSKASLEAMSFIESTPEVNNEPTSKLDVLNFSFRNF